MKRKYTRDDQDKIKNIALRIVASRVARGEINEDDEEALKKAVHEALDLAESAFNAATDYVFR